MRKGLTPNIEAIIDNVAQLECIKPYTLCGGTALAIQLGHRIRVQRLLRYILHCKSRLLST